MSALMAVLKGAGLSRSAGAQTGIVTAIQRLGSALNLNIHLHLLVLDGGYSFAHDRARFHRAPAPLQAELERLLDTLIARITRTLVAAPGIPPRAAFVLPCTSRLRRPVAGHARRREGEVGLGRLRM